jgi:RNA polymerase sigma factor for flagellar operon FliA
MSMEAEEQELWRRYRDEQDVQARDYLFLRYSSWARGVAASVARKLRPGILEWQDHVQNARIGLLEAMSRFDVSRGIDFMAFAKPRVRGAVFNGVRVLQSGSSTRDDRTADRMASLSQGSVDDHLSDLIETVLGLSIGYLLEEGADITPDAEHGEILLDALSQLPSRQRQVLISHYLRQVPFQDIAADWKVTKGRISQIHKQALLGIRTVLQKQRYDRESFF